MDRAAAMRDGTIMVINFALSARQGLQKQMTESAEVRHFMLVYGLHSLLIVIQLARLAAKHAPNHSVNHALAVFRYPPAILFFASRYRTE